MIARGEFRFNEPINIAVASQLSQMTIFLSLCQSQRSEPGLYPISGFPRCLVSEDTLNGNVPTGFLSREPTDHSHLATRLDKRAELIRQRRYNALPVANDPKVVTPSDAPVGGVFDLAKSETKDSKRSLSPNQGDDNKSLNAATPLQTKPSRLSLLTHRSSSRGAAPRASSISTNTDALSPSQTPDARGNLDDPSSAAAWAEKSPLAADEQQVSIDMLRSQSQDMLKATVVHAEQVMPSDGSSTTDENTSDESEED